MTTDQPDAENIARDKASELLNVCRAIHSQRDLPALFKLIAREAARLLNADGASVFLFDRETSELWSIVTLDGKQIRFDARLGIAGAVVSTGKTLNVDRAEEDSRFYAKIDARTGFRTRTMLAVPLRNQNDEIIGTVQVMNKRGGRFGSDDEKLLETLVSQASPALETANLLKEIELHRDFLLKESARLRKEVGERFNTQNIVGTSPQIQEVIRTIEQVADSSAPVLITGESGTGKEMVAKAIHYGSDRAERPFVSLNCAALPETLVESELFGIEKGIATGVDARIGKFEAAHTGTLFLDEIGDLSLAGQAKILRVLQERAVERVGGKKPVSIDVRIITATNKNLDEAIRKGTFRNDLFFRLNTVHVRLPALREVREDIPILAEHFLATYCRDMKKSPMKLSRSAAACLMRHDWPGNVRELENEMRRVAIASRQKSLTEEQLSQPIRGSVASEHGTTMLSGQSLKDAVAVLEKRMIESALCDCAQNQQRAARQLGLSRQGLIKKIKRYGIKVH